MNKSCGTTKANIFESTDVHGSPVYFDSGINPVNSPAQFFVAWAKKILADGLIHTFNNDSPFEGYLWFIDEDQAEAKYKEVQQILADRPADNA
jgi:hypothetical protein